MKRSVFQVVTDLIHGRPAAASHPAEMDEETAQLAGLFEGIPGIREHRVKESLRAERQLHQDRLRALKEQKESGLPDLQATLTEAAQARDVVLEEVQRLNHRVLLAETALNSALYSLGERIRQEERAIAELTLRISPPEPPKVTRRETAG
jgi:hypothetical protein